MNCAYNKKVLALRGINSWKEDTLETEFCEENPLNKTALENLDCENCWFGATIAPWLRD